MAVAYSWYVRGAFLNWERNPEDPELVRRRNYAIEQFDRGVVLEHIAFPIILVTGPLLWIATGWSFGNPWLLLKLLVVVLVFVPLEVVDYHLSHFGGNKRRLRLRGDSAGYELAVRQHWLFLRISTPVVVVFVPLVIFLTVVKPTLWS